MWLSKALFARIQSAPQVEEGLITRADREGIEAGSTVSGHYVESFAPFGYSACPPVGEEVAIISTPKGQLALGTKSKSAALEQGEIMLASSGGASIALKNDGSVVINGAFIIDREGRVINGV